MYKILFIKKDKFIREILTIMTFSDYISTFIEVCIDRPESSQFIFINIIIIIMILICNYNCNPNCNFVTILGIVRNYEKI